MPVIIIASRLRENGLMNHQSHTDALDADLRAAVRAIALPFESKHGGGVQQSSIELVVSQLPLASLSRWERSIRDELSAARQALALQRVQGWRAWFMPTRAVRSPRSLHWVDLCNGDGHIRERALQALDEPVPNAFVFALAARRLNDWVPQVRAAAQEAVLRVAPLSDPEQVSTALCVVLAAWSSWGRVETSDRQVILEVLSMARVANALKDRFITASSGPMASVLSQTLRTSALDADLLTIARQAVQPAVRARAFRVLLDGEASWVVGRRWEWTDVRYCHGRFTHVMAGRRVAAPAPARSALLVQASEDRSPIVRRVAAEALVRALDDLAEDALPLVRRLAADPARVVAERGAFVLKQLNG